MTTAASDARDDIDATVFLMVGDWSRDGKWLALVHGPGANRQAILLPLEGGGDPRVAGPPQAGGGGRVFHGGAVSRRRMAGLRRAGKRRRTARHPQA